MGVSVDAARKFANDDLFMRAGFSGDDGIDPPILRLAMDAVND